MHSPQAARILQKMTPGTMGGESRVASPAGYNYRARSVQQPPTPEIVVPLELFFYGAENTDENTVTHAGAVPSEAVAGDFLIEVLATLDTTTVSPTITDGDPEWTQNLSTFVGAFTSPYRYAFAYTRVPATDTSGDSIAWEWLSGDGIEAHAIGVAINGGPAPLEESASDFGDVGSDTLFVEMGSAGESGAVLFVWSVPGSTSTVSCSSPNLRGHIKRTGQTTDEFGYIDAWGFYGEGPHYATVEQLGGGSLLFYTWIEVR